MTGANPREASGGSRIYGLFRAEGLRFGFRVQGCKAWVLGFWFRAYGCGFQVHVLGFRV